MNFFLSKLNFEITRMKFIIFLIKLKKNSLSPMLALLLLFFDQFRYKF